MVTTGQRRGPWSNSEDSYLIKLVGTGSNVNWVTVAESLGSRTPKQCRERYHQNLKPSLNHDPITPEEGMEINRLVEQLGKRWAEIARRLPGRSDNAVKNWWNGSQNKLRRHDRRRAVHSARFNGNLPPQALSMTAPVSSAPASTLPSSGTSYPKSPERSRPHLPWADGPLPSPCSTDSFEFEDGRNYTLSPVRLPMSTHDPSSQPVSLPPLRDWPTSNQNGPSSLHSLSSVASPRQSARGPIASLENQRQLPTAPTSPLVGSPYQHHHYHHHHAASAIPAPPPLPPPSRPPHQHRYHQEQLQTQQLPYRQRTQSDGPTDRDNRHYHHYAPSSHRQEKQHQRQHHQEHGQRTKPDARMAVNSLVD